MGKIEFRILKKTRCVHFIGTDDISYDYMIDRINALINHPDFKPPMDSFADYENATVSFRDENFNSYCAFFQDLQKAKLFRKWAIYSKQKMTVQSANMHHLLVSDDIEVEVFQKRNRALAFLGITEDDLAEGG